MQSPEEIIAQLKLEEGRNKREFGYDWKSGYVRYT